MRKMLLAVSAIALLGACAPKAAETEPTAPDEAVESATPAEIHESLMVFDSHLDTPANLSKPDFDIMADNPTEIGSVQVDVPKMDRGGLDGGFWVIFTPQGPLTEEAYDAAFKAASARQDEILKMVADHPDAFELAYTADDAERIAASGQEGGPAVDREQLSADTRRFQSEDFLRQGCSDGGPDPLPRQPVRR
jgi:membrane dipeptidase